jgi:cyclopropane fatty-acyl-phospholipid synthase-like methyltransferase
MTDFYQRYPADYHEKTFHIDPSSFLGPLIRYLNPGDHLLDVGCGSGRDLLWLKKQGFNVTGFERSEGLAALARKHAGCEIIAADFQTYDFSDHDFDAILLSGSLVHISHEHMGSVFANIISGLGHGGAMLVSLKEGLGSRVDPDDRRFYLWQDKDLQDMFTRHGFRVLECHTGISKVNKKDIWLSYILRRGSAGPRIRGLE